MSERILKTFFNLIVSVEYLRVVYMFIYFFFIPIKCEVKIQNSKKHSDIN